MCQSDRCKYMFGDAFSTQAEYMRVRNLQKQPVLFGYICGQHSEI